MDGSSHAHHPAHLTPVRRHNVPVVLFVTLCVRGRVPLLADDEAHAAIVQAAREVSHWHVGEYMIMPDHVHFFCAPGIVDPPPIRRWAGRWKRTVGRCDGRLRAVFQEDCWDTQIRNAGHFEAKRLYMRMNPVRQGLVATADAWRFRGRVFDVGWCAE